MHFRSKNENIETLFDMNFGRPIFTTIMPKRTYQNITAALRFDDFESRRLNRSSDRFAPIRDIWEMWSNALPIFFNPNECVTIDEQLLGYRGRCKFKIYMPSKPVKYGMKFWVAVDSKTGYVWKIQPYLGKEAGAPSEKNQGQRVVLDLTVGLKGQNVTADNFFGTYELGQALLKRNLTFVGTLRSNKTFIPPILKKCKKMPLYNSTFAFTHDTTLVSYISRKDKCTILMSTLHHDGNVNSNQPKKLPEIIEYYNSTKGRKADDMAR